MKKQWWLWILWIFNILIGIQGVNYYGIRLFAAVFFSELFLILLLPACRGAECLWTFVCAASLLLPFHLLLGGAMIRHTVFLWETAAEFFLIFTASMALCSVELICLVMFVYRIRGHQVELGMQKHGRY